MFTRRKSEDTVAAEALAQRVHGTRRTCVDCGASAPCDPDAVEFRTGLAGEQLLYGVCRTCAAWRRTGDVDRRAAAVVLSIDRGSPVLDRIRVDRFGAQPHARPERPNRKAWQHVSAAGLAETVERRTLDLQRRQGGPCTFCGVGETPEGTGWASVNGRPRCGSCTERFTGGSEGGTYSDDDQRTIAAAVLCGLSRGGQLHMVHNLGGNVGLVFWSESGRTGANAWPWQHVDVASLRRRARAHLEYFGQTDLLELLGNVPAVVRW